MIYAIKNWDRYQHYKQRNPPWLKLHYELLSSRTWVMLDDSSRVLMVACMLVASRNGGQIDGSPSGLQYLKRVAYLQKADLKSLVDADFLVPLEQEETLIEEQAAEEPEEQTAPQPGVAQVCEHYRQHKPRSRPGHKEKKAIAARLKDGYSTQDLCKAIDGCMRSAWHAGNNQQGRIYQGLELIMRSAKHVDQFLELAEPDVSSMQTLTPATRQAALLRAQVAAGDF